MPGGGGWRGRVTRRPAAHLSQQRLGLGQRPRQRGLAMERGRPGTGPHPDAVLGHVREVDQLGMMQTAQHLRDQLVQLGPMGHPKVREATTEIVERAAERGVAVGIWVPDAQSARFWVEHGVRFVTVSNNELMLFGASATLRRALEQ